MNSDPFDSAAWRTFNMLDSDEAAVFDEAMRHDPVLRNACLEMDRLSAAIAAATAAPLTPQTGQLERLQSRLGLGPPKSAPFWVAVSGWAAAAVLAVLLVLHLTGIIDQWGASSGAGAGNPLTQGSDATVSRGLGGSIHITPASSGKTRPNRNPALAGTRPTDKGPDGKTTAKVETKRLNQEIEVLRDNLEKFQTRDQALFEVVPGMALPIVMTMNPPGTAAEDPAVFARNDERSPLTTLLGDALATLTSTSGGSADNPPPPSATAALSDHPTAIPIYDAARDQGALVVSNLPPADDGEVYNLWVTTHNSGHPIYVGTLPEGSASGADSFDFTLGSTMVLPSGFLLTMDPEDAPATPTAANTILQGPPTLPR